MSKFELKLPKMGESVAEATITSWLKEVGDTIEMDEPIVEIATDKVDSEVPSEVEGVLVERFFEVDEIVGVGQVIAVIEINGEASGGIGLHLQSDIHKKNAELGYWLAEPHWGKGVMSKAVKQMIDYGFKTFEIERIFARPFGTNIGSKKVLDKAGFILEGKFEKTLFKNGEYFDELIYAVRKS